MELMIDHEGVSLPSWDISIDEAVWKYGFIHLRSVCKSLVVSICPSRVLPVTQAAAYYAIADFGPSRTLLRTERGKECEVIPGYKPVINRIYALRVTAGAEKLCLDYAPQGAMPAREPPAWPDPG